jgi:hypothetical protein
VASNPGGFNVALSLPGKNFSVEGWFKPDSVSGTQFLFSGLSSSGNIFYMRQQVVGGAVLVCGIYDVGAGTWHEISGGSISAGTWYHVAMTVSNSGDASDTTGSIIKMCLYQDNALKNSVIYNCTTIPETITNMKIGRCMADDANYFFTGAMDEIRISQTPRYSFTLPVNSPLNLVNNGNFEIRTNFAYPDGWTSSGTANSWDAGQYVSSTHSAKTVNTGSQAYWAQTVTNVDNLSTYRVRAHVNISNSNSGSHAIEIHWQNSGGTDLRTDSYASSATGWTEVIGENITPPANTTQASVRLRTSLTGTYHFDDVVLEREDKSIHLVDGKFPLGLYYLPSLHLLRNSNYELAGNSGLPLGWTHLFGSGAATQSWDTGRYVSGTHSLKTVVTADGQSDWRQYVYNIDPNLQYKLSGSIFATNIVANSHGIAVQWLNSSGNYLGQTAIASTTANAWFSVSAVGISPPAGTAKAAVVLRAYKTGSYNFDDVSFDVDRTAAASCTEIKNAGFNYTVFLGNDTAGLAGCASAALKASLYPIPYTMYLPAGCPSTWITELIAEINAKEADASVALWCAIDEPNMHDSDTTGVINAYDTLTANDDCFASTPHKVWLTFAPRGLTTSAQNAQDFTLLRGYNPGADIIATDVYPVPETCGFSNLPNQTISCIGDYVDILYNQIANWDNATTQRNNQVKPIWMALQGYGKDDDWNSNCNPYKSHGIELQWYDASHNYLGSFRLPAITNDVWCYEFAQSITPPPGATIAYLVLRAYASGVYYFDNITFQEVGGSNMLLNPTAETANGSLPANWGTASWTPHGAATFTWSTNKYVSSSHSLKIDITGSAYYSEQADWRQGPFSVSAAKTYSLSGYIFSQRGSTWEQTRFMAYNAIIHGARGIVYWHQFIPVNSILWHDMKQLATELDGLSTALTSPRSFREVTVSNGAIETLLLKSGSDLYLLAANRSPATVINATVAISGLPLGTITRVYDAGGLTMTANAFTDTFSGYRGHVYKIY